MFQIDANNLPFVRTRQALLILDLQNDFLAPDAILPVRTPSDFLDKIVKLVPEFRASGNVIWIRTCFEASRKFNEPYGDSESVITDAELNQSRRVESDTKLRASPKPRGQKGKEPQSETIASRTEPSPDEDNDGITETYLSVEAGETPQVVLPMSPSANLADQCINAFDAKHDLVYQKTYYSAFKDGALVQILRAKFVTDIYICGVLTNINVFATAMDAARHGYGITIVEDCLGYRSKARHDEALRRLVEYTGCEVITHEELVGDLQQRAKPVKPPPRSVPRSQPREKSPGLEDAMSSLNLKEDRPTNGRRVASRNTAPRTLVKLESTGSSYGTEGNDSEDLQLPARPSEGDGKKRERVKMKIRSRRRLSNSSKAATSNPTENVSASSPSASLQASPAVTMSGSASKTTKSSSSSSVRARNPPDTEFNTPTESDSPILPSDSIAVLAEYAAEENESLSDGRTASLCEGDTKIIQDLLDDDVAEGIFETIRDEVQWQKMSHQGGEVPRLVAVQGEVAKDGTIPIYRHPADESPPLLPFSRNVSLIREQVEKHLGHSVNHVLIQFYRDGTDYISEHTDKTLDIVPKSFIANVSLGAQRTMVFRTKKQKSSELVSPEAVMPRKACKVPLPHNSMCKMGLFTNMRWLHGIRQDKRMASERAAEELAYQGGRISLTFRQIGTFLDKNQQKIWGQGATGKTKEEAKTVVNGNTPDAEKLIRAFGQENQSTEFEWQAAYGQGFDVLHMSSTPRLFLSNDVTANLRVKLFLAEHDIEYEEGTLSPPFTWKDGSLSEGVPDIPDSLPIKFIDNDLSRSTVMGDIAIMLYIRSVYGDRSSISEPESPVELARQFTRFQQSFELLKKWRAEPFNVKPFQKELRRWEAYALEAPYMSGDRPTLTDFAVFPVMEEIRGEWWNGDGVLNVMAWYFRIRHREAAMKVLGPLDKETLQRQQGLEGLPEIKIWE